MLEILPARPLSERLTGWVADNGFAVLAMIVAALVATLVARIMVRRFQRKLEGSPSVTQALNIQRATTLTHALSTSAVVAIWAITALLILGKMNVNLAPLLASAGVAGVALGFGAQSVVRDGLAGFFILLEDQFGVGDTIEVQTTASPVVGRVEALTLRITTLRAFDGTLHVVPNGNILVVSNKSRGWARAIIDVRIAYDEDVMNVREVLDELFEQLRVDPQFHDWIREGPSILGMETLSDYAKVVRVVAETRPSKRYDAERLLRERITTRLAQRGVRVPVPPMSTRGEDAV